MSIKLKTNDILIIDPGYIHNVSNVGESRFDALRCGKVLHSGDDGEYLLVRGSKELTSLGVDSGRIWAMVAEFPCEVEEESLASGKYIIRCPQLNYREQEEFVEDTLSQLQAISLSEIEDDWEEE